MFRRTIVDTGSVNFTHRKEKYQLSYSVTNDGFLLPHYESVGPVRVESYGGFISQYGDLDHKIEKVLAKKLPNLKLISVERYFSAFQAGTLPTSQFAGEEQEVLKSVEIPNSQADTKPEELVTKTRGYVRRTDNPKMGRPAIGSTRKVALSLSDELWDMIDERVANGEKQSAVLRELIEKGAAQ